MVSKKLSLTIAGALILGLFSPALAAARTRYVAFGDSITEGFRTDELCACDSAECQQRCGYPVRLKNLLVAAGLDVGVLNRGLGAERTPEGLTRLDSVLPEGGDVLLLMEGSNDITRNISPETTLANLAEMAQKALMQGMETVHVTLIPRIPSARVDAENVLNENLARSIRDLAFSSERKLVDPFEVLSNTEDLFARYYFEDMIDPVGHPNSAGYQLLAETFYEALVGIDTVPPVVIEVSPADGSIDVAPLATVRVRLYDFGVGIDPESTALMINGQDVEVAKSGGDDWQDLVYKPQEILPPEVVVGVKSSDWQANTMSREELSRFQVVEDPPLPCVPSTTTLCIDMVPGDRRFQVTVHWFTAQDGGKEGDAETIELAPIGLRRGGLFTFFGLQNPEILVKVLDGCHLTGKIWVFVAPTTSLGYELKVVDTAAGLAGLPRSEYEYVVTNPDGRDAPPVSDTAAFDTCELPVP